MRTVHSSQTSNREHIKTPQKPNINQKNQNTPTLAQISEVSSSCYLKGYGDVMQSHGVNIKANVTDKYVRDKKLNHV